ncbi:hypothetical protein [Nitrosomonas sp.]|uniref:hypothetical protein n=1 Tax=Nitrosomonas sp. TaxID=42353 RepID=UPI001DB68DEE|nr:hypothetical protein [Nitrosomonas sp.]MBX3617935.1 hypothetical protein [Nitrosomonas sp.]
MTHHARLNWVMFITIVGVMVFLYFKPQPQETLKYSIFNEPAASVHSVRIVRRQYEIALERSGDQWRMIKPVEAAVDERKAQAIFEILNARSELRILATDLGRFGLLQPNVQLFIDDQSVNFGSFAPVKHQQYVQAKQHVYLISPRYGLLLPRNATELINPIVFPPGEIPRKFVLPQFEIEMQDGQWHITSAKQNEPIDHETMVQWVELWQSLPAAELTIGGHVEADSIDKSLIVIELQDGRVIDFDVLKNESSIILLRTDNGIGYQFPVETGRQLLDPHIIQKKLLTSH